jgi:hypothetical protein
VRWQRRRRRPACTHSRAAVEEACAHGRVAAVAEEADSSGVDGGGGDRHSRERAVGT